MFALKNKRSSYLLLLLGFVAAMFVQLIVITPAQTAFALTPSEEQECFEKLNGYEKPVSSTGLEDKFAPLSKEKMQACEDAGICTLSSTPIVKDGRFYNVYTCTKTAQSAEATATAQSAEVAPLIKVYCGTKPTDRLALIDYRDCASLVQDAYSGCRISTSGGLELMTPAESTNCVSVALKSSFPAKSKAVIQKAIEEGRKASAAILASAKDEIACQDVGGVYDSAKDPPCQEDLAAAETKDECPLPDDTSMRWLGCSIMSVAKVATTKLYGAIQQFLYTPTSAIFDNEPLKKSAAGIRNLAIGLILIAGLVMVIAQATGSDLVDAYTIRKLLPRIGVAIIGIALAWPLLRFAITLTNDVGLLADRLLTGVTAAATGGSSNDLGTNILSAIFVVGAGGGAALFLGAAGLVSLAGTILLAMLIGLFVLAIRQLVIMVCVVLAPLAIAAYVLPGTQKLWSFWKSTLLTTLLMFPIIMFFLSSGEAFAAILGGANSASMSLLAIIVFIAPYFLLPFAFKLAGGLMATIFSIANDKNRGMFDRLRKGRQQAVSKNWEGMKEGNRFRGKNAVSSWANRKLEYGANVGKAGANPLYMKSRMRTALATNAHDEATKFMKENEEANAIFGDDAKVFAAKATNRSEIERRLAQFDAGRFGGDSPNNVRARQDAATQILQAQRQVSEETFQMARARAMPGTGTGYHFKNSKGETQVDYSTMLDDINEAYGSDRNGAGRALAEMRSALANSGHVAGLAGYGTWADQLEKNYELRQKGTYNKAVHGKKMHDVIMADTIQSVPPGNALYGKPTSAAAMGGAHRQRLQELVTSMNTGAGMIKTGQKDAAGKDILRAANQKDIDTALASAAGILDAMGAAAPQNAQAYAAEFMGVEIQGAGGPSGAAISARDLIAERSDSADFNTLRKEWQYKTQQQGEAYEQQRRTQEFLNQNRPQSGIPQQTLGGSPGGTLNS